MAAVNERIRRILEDPAGRVLLGLALPAAGITAAQVLTGVVDTAIASHLTLRHLAALALVVPFFSLVQLVSVGGVGGAIASCIGRSLGARDLARARALVWQAQYLALAAGLACALAWWLGGPALLRALHADAATAALAYEYGLWLFAPGMLMWCQNALSSALRGAGELQLLLRTLVAAYLLQAAVAAALALLAPRLGLVALALGQFAGSAFAVAVFFRRLHRGGTPLDLRGVAPRLERSAFAELGRLAAATSTASAQTGLTLVLTLALAGRLGTEAVAAYGVAARLEFLLVVLLSSVGTAVVTATSVNLGAGQRARVHRLAWLGVCGIGVLFALAGAAIALAPGLWLALFRLDAPVAAAAAGYLRAVGPCWGLLGVGLMSYFVGQGLGRPLPFLFGGTVRLLVLLVLAWLVAGDTLRGLGLAVAVSCAAFGAYAALQLWACTRGLRVAAARLPAPGGAA